MCGGKDRFQIKRTQTGDVWHCRHCASGKYHSPIDFVMAYRHLDFIQAFRLMGGDVSVRRAVAPKPVGEEPLPEWASKFISTMRTALIVRGARPEALERKLEPRQDEWQSLMDELDEKIQAQQEDERQWAWRQAEGELNES
jgi:hypothetical protein